MSRRPTGTRTAARECGNKIRHATAGDAYAQVRQMVRQGASADALNVYTCKYCGAFHVGHRPGRGRRRAS